MDAGDLLFGHPVVAPSPPSGYWEARARLVGALLEPCGVTVAALGDADLALGLGRAVAALAPLGSKLLATNLERAADGATGPAPWTLERCGTLTVGVFALVAPPPDRALLEGARLLEPVEVARATVGTLRARGADFVLLLSHLGGAADQALLRSVPGVDLAVCGCCPGPQERPVDVGGARWVSAMFGGGQLGRVDVMGRDGDRWRIEHRLLPMDESWPADRAIQDRVRALELSFRAGAATTPDAGAAAAPADAPRAKFGHGYCAGCHPLQERAWLATGHAAALDRLPPARRSDPECLECHATGSADALAFALPGGGSGLPGVQCEACHDVRPSHPRGDHGRVGTGVGSCLQCHTPLRSPRFDPRGDFRRAACPRDGSATATAGR